MSCACTGCGMLDRELRAVIREGMQVHLSFEELRVVALRAGATTEQFYDAVGVVVRELVILLDFQSDTRQ